MPAPSSTVSLVRVEGVTTPPVRHQIIWKADLIDFLGIKTSTPTQMAISDGTNVSSITSLSPTVTMERFDASNAGAAATVPGYFFATKRTGGTTGATYNLFGYAQSTMAGSQIVGTVGSADQLQGSTTDVFGLYGQATLFNTAIAGHAYGCELDGINGTGATAPYPADVAPAGQIVGLQVVADTSGVGSTHGSGGILILSKFGSASKKWRAGIWFGTNSVNDFGIDMLNASPANALVRAPSGGAGALPFLAIRNNANNADLAMIASDSADRLRLGTGAADILWGKALVALGGGAGASLGTIGGTGPAVASQNTWMRVVDSAGVPFWVPAWK